MYFSLHSSLRQSPIPDLHFSLGLIPVSVPISFRSLHFQSPFPVSIVSISISLHFSLHSVSIQCSFQSLISFSLLQYSVSVSDFVSIQSRQSPLSPFRLHFPFSFRCLSRSVSVRSPIVLLITASVTLVAIVPRLLCSVRSPFDAVRYRFRCSVSSSFDVVRSQNILRFGLRFPMSVRSSSVPVFVRCSVSMLPLMAGTDAHFRCSVSIAISMPF
jgi:hypothetical protein